MGFEKSQVSRRRRQTNSQIQIQALRNAPRDEILPQGKPSLLTAIETGRGWLHVICRVSGHMTSLSFALTMLPTAKASQWYKKLDCCGWQQVPCLVGSRADRSRAQSWSAVFLNTFLFLHAHESFCWKEIPGVFFQKINSLKLSQY